MPLTALVHAPLDLVAAIALNSNAQDKVVLSASEKDIASSKMGNAETSKNSAKAKEDLAAAAAFDAHVAQIAKNPVDAASARDEVKTNWDAAVADAVVAESKADDSMIAFRNAAAAAGVSYKDAENVLHIPSGPSYLNPAGRLVASILSTDAAGVAASKYLAAADALDSYNMRLADYNNALDVPASDDNKMSVEDLAAMLVEVNLLAVAYNAAQVDAKASAKNADDASANAALALISADAAHEFALAARASANASERYHIEAVNDVTNSASKPISLNLNIEIDADNNINVFGEKPMQPENVIVATYKLGVESLYDNTGNKGLIEFWEPVDAQGDIRVELAHSANAGGPTSYKESAVKMVNGIQRILCDELDCSGCKPFNDAKYFDANGDAIVAYTKQRDFGRVALGTLSHYLFGHVDATSAITNDVEFLKNMLSLTLGTASEKELAVMNESASGPVDRNLAYDPMVLAGVDILIDEVGSAADAKLAKRLIGSILRKGLSKDSLGALSFKSSNVLANDDDIHCLANIVRQVIGQDQTRSMNQDNSQRTVDEHILLRFYPQDVIYMNIKLKKPTVTITPGPSAATGLSVASLADSYANEISFTLKIELA